MVDLEKRCEMVSLPFGVTIDVLFLEHCNSNAEIDGDGGISLLEQGSLELEKSRSNSTNLELSDTGVDKCFESISESAISQLVSGKLCVMISFPCVADVEMNEAGEDDTGFVCKWGSSDCTSLLADGVGVRA